MALAVLLREIEREDLGDKFPQFTLGEWSRRNLVAMREDIEQAAKKGVT